MEERGDVPAIRLEAVGSTDGVNCSRVSSTIEGEEEVVAPRPRSLSLNDAMPSLSNGELDTPVSVCPPELGHDGMDMKDRKAAIDKALSWLRQEMRTMRNEGGQLKTELVALSSQVHNMKVDAIRFNALALKRHSIHGSVSLMESDLYDDDLTPNHSTDRLMPGHGFWTTSKIRRPSERTISLPPGGPSSLRRFLHDYQNGYGLQSPTREKPPVAESTPLAGRPTGKAMLGNRSSRGSSRHSENGDLPSPIKLALGMIDGLSEEDSDVFPPGDSRTGSELQSPSEEGVIKPRSYTSPSSLPDGQPSAEAEVLNKGSQKTAVYQQSKEESRSSTEQGGSSQPKTRTRRSSSTPNVTSTFVQEPQEKVTPPPPSFKPLSRTRSGTPPTISTPSNTSSRSGTPPTTAVSEGSAPHSRSNTPPNASSDSSQDTSASTLSPENGAALDEKRTSPRRGTIRRRPTVTAKAREQFMERQKQQVMVAAENLTRPPSAQGSLRRNGSEGAGESNSTLRMKDQDKRRTVSSSSIGYTETPGLQRSDRAMGSMPCVRDFEGRCSPSGLIQQRNDSADFSLTGGWSQASGSLPSVRDIDIDSVSPSGRYHQRKGSADFSQSSMFHTQQNGWHGNISPMSRESPTGSQTNLAGDERMLRSTSLPVSSGRGMPAPSGKTTSPFWRATSPPRSSSSPFYSMQSSVGGRSSRQHGVSPSIVVGDGPSHQRTASMPVVNTIQPLPELDLINESEASRPTRGTTMYSTLPRKWPKTTEGDGDRLKPERGHVRRHSADFNAPTSGTPVQQPPQVATSAPPKVPPVPPVRRSSKVYQSSTLPRQFRMRDQRAAQGDASSIGYQPGELEHESGSPKRHSGPPAEALRDDWNPQQAWRQGELQSLPVTMSSNPAWNPSSTSLPGSPLSRRKSAADLRSVAMRRAQQAAAAVEKQAASHDSQRRRSSEQPIIAGTPTYDSQKRRSSEQPLVPGASNSDMQKRRSSEQLTLIPGSSSHNPAHRRSSEQIIPGLSMHRRSEPDTRRLHAHGTNFTYPTDLMIVRVTQARKK